MDQQCSTVGTDNLEIEINSIVVDSGLSEGEKCLVMMRCDIM